MSTIYLANEDFKPFLPETERAALQTGASVANDSNRHVPESADTKARPTESQEIITKPLMGLNELSAYKTSEDMNQGFRGTSVLTGFYYPISLPHHPQ